MYYWSRWTNNQTMTSEMGNRDTRSSWQDTNHRQVALRETRPVVVVTRSRTQALSTSFTHQRGQMQERETSSRISLDVRRSRSYTSATRSQVLTSWEPEATTQPVSMK